MGTINIAGKHSIFSRSLKSYLECCGDVHMLPQKDIVSIPASGAADYWLLHILCR